MAAGMEGPGALDEELRRSSVVHLRGLSFSAMESDVAAFFRGLELGPDGVVICVNFKGRSTGHAYVQFASPEIANKALEWNRQQMGNRYIEVYKGHAADMQGALRMVGRGSANRMETGSIINTGIPGMAGHSDMRYTGVIRMRGMPYSCTSADIVAFYKGMQIVPDGIFHCTHANGRPAGEAFVEFVNEETASRAMRLHHKPLGSRYVELFFSTKGEMMTAIQQRMYGLFAGLEDFSYYGSTGQGPESAEALGLQGLAGMNLAAIQAAGLGITGLHSMGDLSESVCIKMKNLPYSAQPRDIMKYFEGYKIAPNGIYMVFGLTDRPTGEAFVEFVSVDEARRAMERNRRSMGSRYVELLRATKSELLIAMGELPGFNTSELVDPSVQLLLLQQQAAAGAFGMSGAFTSEQGAGSWTNTGSAAAGGGVNSNAMPPGFAGPSSAAAAFNHHSTGKMQGAPYRSVS